MTKWRKWRHLALQFHIAQVQVYLHMKFEHDWLSGFEVGNFQRYGQLSNMATRSCDLHELRNLNTQSTVVYPYEIWAWSIQWFWRRRFSKVFEKSNMAARSHDLDQPKHIKKLFTVEGHILAKFHDSGSNGLSAIRNLKFRNNNNNKYSCCKQRCRASSFVQFHSVIDICNLSIFLCNMSFITWWILQMTAWKNSIVSQLKETELNNIRWITS